MIRSRYELPPINTLQAFEAAARLGSITRAAEERETSHSAISRSVRALERALGVPLFERRGRGVALTKSGETYYLAIQSAMDSLHAAGQGLRDHRTGLVIGATLEMSALLLHPIFPQLTRALGDGIAARIVVYHYDLIPLLMPSGLDIVFEAHDGPHPDASAVPILREEIVPVASPAFVERFGSVLAGHPRHWHEVPRLKEGLHSPGWSTWETWFDAHRCAPPGSPVETFEDHFNVLSAAVAGDGLAVGWNGFMKDYFETGKLIAVRDSWLQTKATIFGLPTPNGRNKGITPTCLNELRRLAEGLCTPSPASAPTDTSPDSAQSPA